MLVDTDNLVAVQDIADLCGVSKQAVGMWKVRHADFPGSVVTIAHRPLYLKDEVIAWVTKRNRR